MISSTELLQNLIRFDTTNPPGNETECCKYIGSVLETAGIESTILANNPLKGNLVARIAGEGTAPPFLMYGHVDVVTTVGQQWQHPPFEGKFIDGAIWGRGALDMKGGVAMMLAAFLRIKEEGYTPPGDIIFTALADEETRGECGVNYLVDKHADYFKEVQYAIGEFGGFTLHIGGKRFYPIQVSEKQICHLKATFRGPGGHGSMPLRGGAMAKLGSFLQALDQKRLPVHITPVAELMFTAIASRLPFPSNIILRQILNPKLTNLVLKILGTKGQQFDPLMHNTISPTIVRGGEKFNVIPSEIVLEIDTRLLPGFGPKDIMKEIHDVAGNDAELEVINLFPSVPAEPDMGMYDLLASVIKDADADAIPVPLLLPAATDASVFSKLGIQTYGFTPMKLPEDMNFWKLIHAADERIPVEALEFGTEAVYNLLKKL